MTCSHIDFIDQQLEKRMREDLIAYENSHGIHCDYQKYSFTIKNGINVVGILNTYTAFAEVYIEDIWVDAKYRKKGYGKQLVTAFEKHFENRGFNNINLCTSDFQAPEFYKKCEFTLEFIRQNRANPKLSKYFFVKFFKNKNQDQGIVRKKA